MKTKWGIAFSFVVLIWALSFKAQGAELREMHTSVRALGMGNAYTSLASDVEALFYNPAGLARTSAYTWRIGGLQVGLSGMDSYSKLQDLKSQATFASALNSLYGEHLYNGVSGMTAFTAPYFGAAIYDSFVASLEFHSPALPSIDAQVINDFGYAVGFGLPLGPGVHSGAVIRRIQRTGTEKTYDVSVVGKKDPTLIISDITGTKGVGYAADLGFDFTVPGPVAPTVSFVWKNVGVTKFKPDALVAPPQDRDEMIIGAAMDIDAAILAIRPAFDFKYLNQSDVQIGKKINFGVEFDLPLLALRAGYHQGYYTMGAGLSLGLIMVDVATYGVELGEYPGQKEDRRYAVSFSLELGFDPGSGIFGGGGGGSGAGAGGKGVGGGRGGSGAGGRGLFGGSRLKQRR